MSLRIIKPLMLLLAGAALGGCALPLVSESEIESEAVGQFKQMKNQMEISTSAATNSYVNCVARSILDSMQGPYADKDWEVVVFEDDSINAFAMPGGKIGVFTGLLKVAENQDQLAAVIGHEIAHVTEQHAVERVNREMTTQIGVVGATAAIGGPQGTYDLVRMGAQLGLSLPYGRKQESESDLVGVRYMAAAGFDPRESVQLWKNMDKSKDGAPPEFLSTHPSSDTRISDLVSALPGALSIYNEARANGKKPRCRR